MAKGKSRRGRDTVDIANQRLPRVNATQSTLTRPYRFLSEIEDRRFWHPEGYIRPARSFPQPYSRVITYDRPRARKSPAKGSPYSKVNLVSPVLGFEAPRQVALCVRRKQRKEVLFALKKSGRNGGRKYRRNFYSRISCKR